MPSKVADGAGDHHRESGLGRSTETAGWAGADDP
jgi:hypothetical protein